MISRPPLARMALAGLCVLAACSNGFALTLSGTVSIHDPSRIYKENGRYYLFGTGTSTAPIRSRYSDDLTTWAAGPAVFSGIPQWALDEVTPNAGFFWAPDVFLFNNQYRLYYSLSSFGSQNSVIGMATNTTLDFNSPNYVWVDQGMVIESEVGSPYNAIDAGIFHDDATGRMWMTWGSFWNGIYITELDPATGKRISPTSETTNIARNPASSGNAIEAPHLTRHGDYYYLFVNWDRCCQGVNSTYKIRVGRSESPTGPFVDRNGTPMTAGGGELFMATEAPQVGPGHFSDFVENGVHYFAYHYYDSAAGGASKLAIDEFVWAFDGWPVRVSDLPRGDYNHNGIVDAADYVIWRNTVGSTTDLRANGDNFRGSANRIDRADYLFWKGTYGVTYYNLPGAAAGGEVPEPAALLLAALGAPVCLPHRRRAPTSPA